MIHRCLKISRLAAAAVFAIALAQPAMAGGGRSLPELALVDGAGLAVDSASLHQSVRWVLVVLDAGMGSSQSLVNTLARHQEGYAQRLVIVVGGAGAQAFIETNRKLPGIRWLMDPERGAGPALGLKATPVVLALDENSRIAWQLAGQPKRGPLAPMVAQWLQLAPVAMPESTAVAPK